MAILIGGIGDESGDLIPLSVTEQGELVISNAGSSEGGGLSTTDSENLATIATATGTDVSSVSQLAGGLGIRGWLSGIFSLISSRLPALSNGDVPVALPSTQLSTLTPPAAITNYAEETGGNLATIASDFGSAGTGIAQPTGGSGLLGWLSGIYFSGLAAGTVFTNMYTEVTNIYNLLVRPTVAYIQGTVSTSGNNSIITAPGSGSIYITHLALQNESSTATTIILIGGSTNMLRFLGQTQGSITTLVFPRSREMKLPATSALILNLNGANQIGYSIGYYVAP